MRNILKIAFYAFKLPLKSRSVIVWSFVMPLGFMLVFGVTFTGGSQGRKAQLVIDNRDGGFLSKALIGELGKENLHVILKDTLREKAVRTLTIPAGFTDSVLSRKRAELRLITGNGSDSRATKAVSIAVYRSVFKVLTGTVSIELSAIDKGLRGISMDGDSLSGNLRLVVDSGAMGLGELKARCDSILSLESLVTVKADFAGRAARIPSGFEGSVPGSLVMFVLMTMVFSGEALVLEKSNGILRRYGYAPVSKGEIIMGKLLGRGYLAGIQSVFFLAVGVFVFRITLGNSPLGLALVILAFVFSTGAFSLFFGSLFKHMETVSSIAIITSLSMAALGGCWWPIEIVPRPLQLIAFVFPTGWAMNGLNKIISFGYGVGDVYIDVLVLTAMGALFLLIAQRRLRFK